MSDINPVAPMGIFQEIDAAQALVEETVAALQTQKTILKQRGMSLPPMVLNALAEIQQDLQHLTAALQQEQVELQQLRALATLSAKITTSLDVSTVLQETIDVVIALTKAERGYLILYDAETQTLDYRIQREHGVSQSDLGELPHQISTSIIKQVIETRSPLLTDNAAGDVRLQRNASIANYALRSVLAVPLLYRDRIVGVIYVDNRLQTGVFTEREMHLLTAFANTAAVAIMNARLYAEIQRSLTEITQVKELMDNVFASIVSGVIASDSADKVTIFNRAAGQLLDLLISDAIGKSLLQVLPGRDDVTYDYVTHVREHDEPQTFDLELVSAVPGVGAKVLNLKLAPLKDQQQRRQGMAVVLDDVTQRRERDQQLKIIKTYLPPEMVENIDSISALALGGKRRDVTCIFAEVYPVAVLKALPPKQAMETINVFLAVATQCIHDTQGIVDKYMSTDVMALYNSQLSPQENHPWLALESALMMRDAFMTLYRSLGIDPNPHYYRIGIHTGIATLGNVGSLNRRDFTAIGDTINLAKRIEENSHAGQILISEYTLQWIMQLNRGELPAGYHFTELAPIQAKGRKQATRVYEVFRS